MNINGTYNAIERLLAEHGEMSEAAIAEWLRIPPGNVRALLISRNCFGKNAATGRWGIRDTSTESDTFAEIR